MLRFCFIFISSLLLSGGHVSALIARAPKKLSRATLVSLLKSHFPNDTNVPFYINETTGLITENVAAASGFQFSFRKPQYPKWYSLPTVHSSISSKMGNLGLKCSQNTPTKVGSYSSQLVGQFNKGIFEWVTSSSKLLSSASAAPAWPSSTNIVSNGVGGADYGKMMVMMKDTSKLGSLYYVSHTTSSGKYTSSSLGSILETFRQAGNFVGQLQDGQQVDAAHVGNLVSDMLQSLTETTQKNWNYHKNDVMMAMVPDPKGTGARMLAGVYYDYKAAVADFKNKKVEKHSASYSVDNWSVIFADQTTLDYTFKMFTKL